MSTAQETSAEEEDLSRLFGSLRDSYWDALQALHEAEDEEQLKLQLLHTWVADLLAQNASLVDAVDELEERAIAQQLAGFLYDDSGSEEQPETDEVPEATSHDPEDATCGPEQPDLDGRPQPQNRTDSRISKCKEKPSDGGDWESTASELKEKVRKLKKSLTEDKETLSEDKKVAGCSLPETQDSRNPTTEPETAEPEAATEQPGDDSETGAPLPSQLRREVSHCNKDLSEGKDTIVSNQTETLQLAENLLENNNIKLAATDDELDQNHSPEEQVPGVSSSDEERTRLEEMQTGVAERERELREEQLRLEQANRTKAMLKQQLKDVEMSIAQYESHNAEEQHSSNVEPSTLPVQDLLHSENQSMQDSPHKKISSQDNIESDKNVQNIHIEENDPSDKSLESSQVRTETEQLMESEQANDDHLQPDHGIEQPTHSDYTSSLTSQPTAETEQLIESEQAMNKLPQSDRANNNSSESDHTINKPSETGHTNNNSPELRTSKKSSQLSHESTNPSTQNRGSKRSLLPRHINEKLIRPESTTNQSSPLHRAGKESSPPGSANDRRSQIGRARSRLPRPSLVAGSRETAPASPPSNTTSNLN
ncbi:myb-like protein Z isoform X2 [Bacillus rossius redtenbacheri]|uniref:myb-like protein Z isoform X2 n=1 Tax=Bacillus rossius redtenbacheri TaxID=93214 RepID=UPI002FDD784F